MLEGRREPRCLHAPPLQQVFVSVDDLEPPRPLGPEDPRPEAESGAEAGPTGTAMVEQQSVEFDSPDSGLPSSRNYSVTSGIQSSIDEGQMGFEEEDGAGEEGSAGMDPKAQVSEPQEPGQEKALPAGELEAGEELAAMCAAAYTVCARSQALGTLGRMVGWPGLSWRWAPSPSLSRPTGLSAPRPLAPCFRCVPLFGHHLWPLTHP